MIGIKRCITLLALLVPLLLVAQTKGDIEHAKPWELKSYARQATAIGDVYLAIDYYERYLEKRQKKYKQAFALAQLYERARDYTQALAWYERICEQEGASFPLALYHKALMQQHLGKYTEASENFLAFKKAYRGGKDSKRYNKLVKLHVAGCELAPALLDSTLEVKITHLDTSINKPHIELSPLSLDANNIIFASLRADSVPIVPLRELNIAPRRRFYTAERVDKVWESRGLWLVPFNLGDDEIGNGTFAPDGQAFYFSRCARNYQHEMICGIWVSHMDDGDWLPAVPLGPEINDPRYNSTMPSLATESDRGRLTLYFVSNRPGGKGGTDIWYTVYDDRNELWKPPKNAGTKINTAGDELSPFYDEASRNLYFSSNGWPGLGGHDIFRSTGELRNFVPPANVGVPFNSSADDLYMTIGANREEGFFVSNREGGTALTNPTCCDDIYFFSWTEYLYLAVEGEVEETEETSGKTVPVAGAKVTLNVVDQELGSVPIESQTTGSDGAYRFTTEAEKDYNISVEREGYFTRSIPHSTRNAQKSDTTTAPTLAMEPIVEEKAIELENIYYDFDKATLTAEAKSTLNQTLLPILRDNPTLVVEIGAHTDSKGTDSYNQKLSQNRAKSVVTFLIEKGIGKKRLQSRGYGESQLRVEDKVNGTYDEARQQQNRRTEFKVVGTVKLKPKSEDDY